MSQTYACRPLRPTAQRNGYAGRQASAQQVLEGGEKELTRRRQIAAIKSAAGGGKNKDHPELKADPWRTLSSTSTP